VRGQDRPLRLTRAHADSKRNEMRRVTLTRLEEPASVVHPVRGLPQHALHQPQHNTQLAHCVRCIRRVERTRVELRCERFSFGTKGVEHQFVL
jgi:hypothetical protein